MFVKNLFFKHKYDKNKCYLTIKSGTGGQESMDFVDILLQMYLKFLNKNNIKHEISSINYNESLINEVSLFIDIEYAYGFFKEEAGVHRLTRVSPFGNGKLHTSFTEISIMPYLNNEINIKINKKDLRIDTYRGSGAGGQHRNKTDSAVRITHLPTGLVTQCEGERSQHYNKDFALKQLYSKLLIIEENKNKDINDTFKSDNNSQWGNQIRSYLFNNNIVKDHKNGNEYNINNFLEGNIDNKYLRYIK
jgi:peptide chain release factor 2